MAPKLVTWMKDAGFEGVTEHVFSFPIGVWMDGLRQRQIGLMTLTAILDGLDAFSMRLLCTAAGWEQNDVDRLLAEVYDELAGGAFHAEVMW